MKKYIVKNQNGKYIHERICFEAVIHMVHNDLDEVTVDGHRITVDTKKSTADGILVIVNIEGI